MNVSGLQGFIRDLGKLLGESGASKVSGELVFIADKLEPFQDSTLREFGKFLERAKQIAEGGTGAKKRVSSGINEAAIQTAFRTIQELYDSALDPAFSEEVAEQKVGDIRKRLKASELNEVARRFGLTKKRKNMDETAAAILDEIVNRRHRLDRASR